MICLVDERISNKCERALLKRGFRVIKMPPSDRLGTAVASHPDMLLFYHRGNIITSAEYCEKFPCVFSDIREFSNATLTFADELYAHDYPNDAIFNALTIGEFIFIKEDTASLAVKGYAKRAGLTVVPTKQGYPACTVLPFGNSAITADRGIADTLTKQGIKVTLISNGDITLPPYEYGFIGGAAGVLGNTVYFLGDISLHRDFDKIKAALDSEGYISLSLSDEPLSDLGRIIFID